MYQPYYSNYPSDLRRALDADPPTEYSQDNVQRILNRWNNPGRYRWYRSYGYFYDQTTGYYGTPCTGLLSQDQQFEWSPPEAKNDADSDVTWVYVMDVKQWSSMSDEEAARWDVNEMFKNFESQLAKNAYSESSCRAAFISKLNVYANLFNDDTVAQLYSHEQSLSNDRYQAEYDRIQAECPQGTMVVSYGEDFHSYRNAEGGESNCAAVSVHGDPAIRLMNALNLEQTAEFVGVSTGKTTVVSVTTEADTGISTTTVEQNPYTLNQQKNVNPDGTTYSSDADLLKYANGNMTAQLAEDSRTESRCGKMSARLAGVIACDDVCDCNVGLEIDAATMDGDDDDIAINKECDNQDVYDFFTKDFFRYVRDCALAFVADASVPDIQPLLNQWDAVHDGSYTAPADEADDGCESDAGCASYQTMTFATVDPNDGYYHATYYDDDPYAGM